MIRMILFFIFTLTSALSFTMEEARPAVSPSKLDQALDNVLSQREYQWRLPREKKEENEGFLVSFWKGLVRFTRRWVQPVWEFFRNIQRWILDRIPFSRSEGENAKLSRGGQNPLLILLIILVAIGLVFAYWRWRKRKQEIASVLEAKGAAAIPDIREEDVFADQLPEEEWSRMSVDLLSRGEFRLALRALFLASLAYLGRLELIRIARFKSNRDYMLELDRKARERAALLDLFRKNVFVLEQVWYGRYPVDESLVRQFARSFELMKEQASQA